MTDHLDDLAGDALERIVRRHHRRRLTKLGHGAVLAPSVAGPELWVTGTLSARGKQELQARERGVDLPMMRKGH